MSILAVRWLLLPAAVAGCAACALSGPTLPRAAVAVVCGAGWYGLSRAKARSLDRDVLGIPPRR